MKYERLTKKGMDWHDDVQCDDEEIYNRLAELEDKIESGTLIELPCKVGDVVYAPHWHFGEWDKIVPYQITNITITQNKKLEWTKKYRAMEVMNGKTIDWQLNFAFDEIGKKVFLTKEEAEKRIEEIKGENTK